MFQVKYKFVKSNPILASTINKYISQNNKKYQNAIFKNCHISKLELKDFRPHLEHVNFFILASFLEKNELISVKFLYNSCEIPRSPKYCPCSGQL
jgi:hypothetical protein